MFRHYIIGRLIISVPFSELSEFLKPTTRFDSNGAGDKFLYLHKWEFAWCVPDGVKPMREYDNLDNGYTKNGFKEIK